jgi:hypothetical protein
MTVRVRVQDMLWNQGMVEQLRGFLEGHNYRAAVTCVYVRREKKERMKNERQHECKIKEKRHMEE